MNICRDYKSYWSVLGNEMIVFKKGKDTDCGEFTVTESSLQYVLNCSSHSTAARGRARFPPCMGASSPRDEGQKWWCRDEQGSSEDQEEILGI